MTAAGLSALVIDDDSDIREVLCAILEPAGFHVDVLTDGIDALDLKKWYDVILLDWKMPVFGGQHLTDYWQLTNPRILERVIVLTGFSRLTADGRPATFGVLPKPFDFQLLLDMVEQCVTSSRRVPEEGNHV